MAKRAHKSGVYVIEQVGTNRFYIGSSADISNRWLTHRRELAAGTHHCAFLQNAWNKHGSEVFLFRILEECHPADLITLEQEYIDALRPMFNNSPTAGSRRGSKTLGAGLERVRASARRRSARTTHCPVGHEYTPENTYLTKRNQRVCLRCAADKQIAKHVHTSQFRIGGPVCKKGHAWTPENTITLKNGTRQCRACKEERAATRYERAQTPEQREKSRAQKRADFQKHRVVRLADSAARDKERRRLHTEARVARGEKPGTMATCRKGHPWTPETTLQWKTKRLCAICHRAARDRLKAQAV